MGKDEESSQTRKREATCIRRRHGTVHRGELGEEKNRDENYQP